MVTFAVSSSSSSSSSTSSSSSLTCAPRLIVTETPFGARREEVVPPDQITAVLQARFGLTLPSSLVIPASESEPETRHAAREQVRKQREASAGDDPVAEEYQPGEGSLDLFRRYWQRPELTLTELRAIVLQFRSQALRVYPYRCIRECRFAEPRMASTPTYQRWLEQPGGGSRDYLAEMRLLDIGCCLATDLRRCIADGAQLRHLVGVDLEAGFLQLGAELFQDRDAVSERLVALDLLEDATAEHWRAGMEMKTSSSSSSSSSTDSKSTSPSSSSSSSSPSLSEGLRRTCQLIQKMGGLDAVYCGSVLHLLTRPDTERLVRSVKGLLQTAGRHAPGYAVTFFGRTVGSGHPTEPVDRASEGKQQQLRFLHSVATLQGLLEAEGFVDVVVQPVAADMPRRAGEGAMTMLQFEAKWTK